MYTSGPSSIFCSTDDGLNWLEINRPMSGGQIGGIFIDSTGNLYSPVLTYPTNDYIHRSSDNGGSWTYILRSWIYSFGCNTSGLLLLSGLYWDWAFYYNLYKSTAYGNSWDEISHKTFLSLTVTKEGKVYGYNDFTNNMQFSSDTGQTWIDYSSGLPSGRITSLVIDTSGYLVVGTPDGVYRTVSQVTSVKSNEIEQPTEYFLSQNYPNPFNPTTTISFAIPKNQNVELKVYDILGTEVVTLVNEEKPQGSYEIQFEGSGLTSGIYFYQLKTSTFVETKKMILMK